MNGAPQSVLKPGQKIRVFQEVDRREGNWTNEVVGTVVAVTAEKTGSWFAHGKDDRFWLWRVRLRKEDGELTTLTVDQYTRFEILSDAPEPAAG